MTDNLSSDIHKKFVWAGLALTAVLTTGTIGYWFIGQNQYSLLDCLYMTVITVATIGFSEIIDMSGNPAGRVFTMFIAILGVGTLTFIFSNFTAFLVEGELKEVFWRRKMDKMIKKLTDHYILCGVEGVGTHIVSELYETKRPHIIVDIDRKKIEKLLEVFPEKVFIEGDATENDVLLKAGIKDAKGLFAATGDDNQNLVISLTAKQLNPDIKVVAGCYDYKNIEKMKKAGADSVVSPTFIGGLRMASEMIRPTVVSFLDVMLRDKEKGLRIEDVPVSESLIGKPVMHLNMEKYPNTLLLAIRTGKGWIYNPPADHIMEHGDSLIIMTTPAEKSELEKFLH